MYGPVCGRGKVTPGAGAQAAMEGVQGVVLRKETGMCLLGGPARVVVPACGAAGGLHRDVTADPLGSLGQAMRQDSVLTRCPLGSISDALA